MFACASHAPTCFHVSEWSKSAVILCFLLILFFVLFRSIKIDDIEIRSATEENNNNNNHHLDNHEMDVGSGSGSGDVSLYDNDDDSDDDDDDNDDDDDDDDGNSVIGKAKSDDKSFGLPSELESPRIDYRIRN